MTTATDILDALDDSAEGGNEVSVGQINDHVGHRGIGALLAIPAAVELTPIGGVPGVPTVLACIVGLFAVQILLGRSDMWLPGFLEHRHVPADRLEQAVGVLRPAAGWSDRHLGRHLPILVDPPVPRLAAIAVLALCCTVPILELVPFASSIPMGVIVLFGLAMVVRDGRVMALAWLASGVAVWGIWSLWP